MGAFQKAKAGKSNELDHALAGLIRKSRQLILVSTFLGDYGNDS